MKKMLLAVTIVMIASACTGKPLLPSQASLEFENYQQRCGGCHEPVEAEKHYDYQWERLLTLMERQLEQDHKEMAPLSSKEAARLLQYIKLFAKTKEDELADPNLPRVKKQP